MKKNHLIIAASLFLGVATISGFWLTKEEPKTVRVGADDALLALIKNDKAAFEAWIKNGGDLMAQLPMIDGKVFTVAEGLAYFERTEFIKYLQENKISFLHQRTDGQEDILLMALRKNNPELFALILKESPNLNGTYGDKGWTLMHFAASGCYHKMGALLDQEKKLKYDLKAKDGSIPMNLAVQNDCLPFLAFWKDKGADFTKKDGRGMTALSLMKNKKDAAMTAFFQSFSPSSASRASASVPKEVNFYKKRVVPEDKKIDYSALIEPEDRPLDSVETAEHSEFAD